MSAPPQRSLLSRGEILRHRREGNIVINPFFAELLNRPVKGQPGTASYDARLGPWFYRQQHERGSSRIFNPFDLDEVRAFWGKPQYATRAAMWMHRMGRQLRGISENDLIIVVEPGETILAHTIEFIGGRRCVTTEMRARSTMGRVGITVCKCAGWGDVGFLNRWTMEITNVLENHAIPLPVGLRIAQIAFYQVDPLEESYAGEGGNYQHTDDVEELMRSWTPEMMLPRLDRDPDIGHFHEFLPDDLKHVSIDETVRG